MESNPKINGAFRDPEKVSNTLTILKNEDKPCFHWTSCFVPPKSAMLKIYHLYRTLHKISSALVTKNILATMHN